MDIPTFKGENLNVKQSNQSITIEDPNDPMDKFISSDKPVNNLENMR